MVMALVQPLQIVHAQAMDQHQELARGPAAGGQGGQVQRQPIPVEPHAGAQWVVVALQAVAHHAVEGGEHGLALPLHCGGRRIGFKKRLQPRQTCLQARVHQACHAPNALVDQPGQAARLARLRPSRQAQRAQHRLVHPLGHAADARGGLCGQPRHSPQVGRTQLAQRMGFGCVGSISARSRWGRHGEGSVQGMRCGDAGSLVVLRTARWETGSATAPPADCPG
ncbi:hypothetical protein D3C71_1460000 [compost metagenome]